MRHEMFCIIIIYLSPSTYKVGIYITLNIFFFIGIVNYIAFG